MKGEKVFDNTSKASLRKTENFTLYDKLCKDHGADKSRESFYTSKCNPAMLTNWREISRRKPPFKFPISRDVQSVTFNSQSKKIEFEKNLINKFD